MTAKIKLNAASGGGSFSLQAPSSSSNNRVISLPDIADGTLLTSQSSLDSPKLSPAISAGIKQADQWRITADFSASSSIITSNWERNDTLFSYIGNGMTESSGIFTFPETGIYHILFNSRGNATSNATTYTGINIQGSQNSGSNYLELAATYDSASTSSSYFSLSCTAFFDVTDISTCRVKFAVASQHSVNYNGGTDKQDTGVTFIRLGDT